MLGLILWISFGVVGFLIGTQVVSKNSLEGYNLFGSKEDQQDLLLRSQLLGPILLFLILLLILLLELKDGRDY